MTPALGTPASGTLTNCDGLVATTGLTATGTKDSTTYLRGDNTWATVSGGGGSSLWTESGSNIYRDSQVEIGTGGAGPTSYCLDLYDSHTTTTIANLDGPDVTIAECFQRQDNNYGVPQHLTTARGNVLLASLESTLTIRQIIAANWRFHTLWSSSGCLRCICGF